MPGDAYEHKHPITEHERLISNVLLELGSDQQRRLWDRNGEPPVLLRAGAYHYDPKRGLRVICLRCNRGVDASGFHIHVASEGCRKEARRHRAMMMILRHENRRLEKQVDELVAKWEAQDASRRDS